MRKSRRQGSQRMNCNKGKQPAKRMRSIDRDFQFATVLGDEEQMERLLNDGADINSRSPSAGVTALVMASALSRVQTVRWLLENGADPNLPKRLQGETPLYIATLHNRVETVELLLDHGANVDVALIFNDDYDDGFLANFEATTPLFTAVELGFVEIVRSLISHGANIRMIRADDSYTVLHAACCWNDQYLEHTVATGRNHEKDKLEIFDLLLDITEKDMTVFQNSSGLTPIQLASKHGHAGIVKKLLDFNPDSALICNHQKQSPLWTACYYGRTGVVKLLLGNNVANSKLNEYPNPLFAAIERGHGEIVDLLIHAGVDPNFERPHDSTPLHEAAKYGRMDAAPLLIQYGASAATQRWTDGRTPLHIVAASSRHEESDRVSMAELFLSHGNDPLLPDAKGVSSLELACVNQTFPNLVRLLLESSVPNLI